MKSTRAPPVSSTEKRLLMHNFDGYFDKAKAKESTRGSFTSRAYDHIKHIDEKLAKPGYRLAATIWDKVHG